VKKWLSVVGLALVVMLSGCDSAKPQFKAVDITGADYAQGFTLADFNGQTHSLSDFKGKVVVLFFGYTQCPDVCPTTLSELVEAKKLLGANGDKLQGVFVTLDPERDTAELLKNYVTNFDPSFVAFVPTLAQLPALGKDFKLYFQKVQGKTPGSYTLDHTAASYVYDPQGKLRLFVRYGSGARALAQDVSLLLK